MTSRHPVGHNPLRPGERLDELAATLLIFRKQLVAIERIATTIDHIGSAVEVLRQGGGGQGQLPGLTEDSGEEEQARSEVRSWLERGLDVRSVLDAEYPWLLHEVYNRPPLLFRRGTWRADTDAYAISVVGTRKPTVEGERRATRLTRELVQAGFPIASGLAEGIDTIAHETALAEGGRTFAVLGHGHDHVYPASNRRLAERIVSSGGALISQFFPHQPPTKWTFPLRNVVMSGLSIATVVVEASETSGAKIQAEKALEHGRVVFFPRSLVENHPWAAAFVTRQPFDARLFVFDAGSEIPSRLISRPPQFTAPRDILPNSSLVDGQPSLHS